MKRKAEAITISSENLRDLLANNPTCMIVSADETGRMRGRSMRAVLIANESEFLFYTRLSGGKSEALASDGHVCLCFGSPHSSDDVTITGHAALITDEALIREKWNTFVDAWFPEGPSGGDVGIIRVEPDEGEYRDGNSGPVFSALKMVVAPTRRESPDGGENRVFAL